MNINRFRQYIFKLYNTTRNIFLFSLNNLLKSTASILQSETLDGIRIRYGNWYNYQLMSRFINCDYHLPGKHIEINLETMETLGNIVIANIYHSGLSEKELSTYLSNTIGTTLISNVDSLQINNQDSNHSKLVFPL